MRSPSAEVWGTPTSRRSSSTAPASPDPAATFLVTLQQGFFGRNEAQSLRVNANGGTFTLSFTAAVGQPAQTTAPIAYDPAPEAVDANAAAIQSALEALGGIGPGNVTVIFDPNPEIGGHPPFYRITFTGALGETNVNQLVANPANLINPGTSSLDTVTNGHAPGFEGTNPATVPCDIDPVEGSAQDVEADISGLQPNTTYHVRLRAENLGGVEAPEQSFHTNADGPSVAAGTVGNLTHDSARLTAYVDANNSPTTDFFELSTPSPTSPAPRSCRPTKKATHDRRQRPRPDRLRGLLRPRARTPPTTGG